MNENGQRPANCKLKLSHLHAECRGRKTRGRKVLVSSNRCRLRTLHHEPLSQERTNGECISLFRYPDGTGAPQLCRAIHRALLLRAFNECYSSSTPEARVQSDDVHDRGWLKLSGARSRRGATWGKEIMHARPPEIASRGMHEASLPAWGPIRRLDRLQIARTGLY